MYRVAVMDEQIVSTIRDYLAGHDAVQVVIFGSYARGEAVPSSDIDVVEYGLALGELVGWKINLVTKPSLSPHFRNDALSRMQVIYG